MEGISERREQSAETFRMVGMDGTDSGKRFFCMEEDCRSGQTGAQPYKRMGKSAEKGRIHVFFTNGALLSSTKVLIYRNINKKESSL